MDNKRTSDPLNDLVDFMGNTLFGMTKNQAISNQICISCKRPWEDHTFSQAGKKEYFISGLCEECFDNFLPTI